MRNLFPTILIAGMVPFLAIIPISGKAQSQLHSLERSIATGADDVEEAGSGTMYLNSTDLELVYDNSTTGNQTIGLRFTNLQIPAGATISKAYIQFTTDELTSKSCNLLIEGEAIDNAAAFISTAYNVSSRSRTSANVSWSPSPWRTLGEAGPNQASPEISSIIQEIVGRPAWQSDNSLVIFISGKGKGNRVAHAYEHSASGAPRLVVEYTTEEIVVEPTPEPEPEPIATDNPFPVQKNAVWKFHDKGEDLGTAWTAASYDDAAWAAGAGPLGYGNSVNTTLSFGTNSSSKHLTYYMRHAFNVEDATAIDSLVFNIMRDDGAVVYLNGVEQFRTNMPAGTISYTSTASTTVSYGDETTYFSYKIPAGALRTGVNVLAVSVHQDQAGSSDLSFDMEVIPSAGGTSEPAPEPTVSCDPASSDKIGCFTSIKPDTQKEILVYPEATHSFQQLAKSGVSQYTSGSTGTMPIGNDFTGYFGKGGSSTEGALSVNHENSPGGVSLLTLAFDGQTMLWNVNGIHKTDFSSVIRTDRNCSGGITPWGTLITSEETFTTSDANSDGYQDVGWNVEVDPFTGKIRDYDGDGKADKLWAMGRMQHENVAVGSDQVTVYQGEDGGSSCVYKFVANQPGNLSSGTLFVLKRSTSNPSLGEWIQVPNSTQSDRNNTRNLASSLGGTNWSNVEDVEFGPDGKIYFTSKVTGTIWRFKDNGSSVAEIEAWVTNQDYTITHSSGTQSENFGTGIDNLVFDGEGNLWALQDGGRYHLWVIRPDHTPASPKVDLFATMPIGAEGTGLTFSPDYRYGFLSIQHPSGTNSQTQTDAAGNVVKHNAPTTIVFARKEYLGKSAVSGTQSSAHGTSVLENFKAAEKEVPQQMQVTVYPNPFRSSTKVQVSMVEEAPLTIDILSLAGTKIETLLNSTLGKGNYVLEINPGKKLARGTYLLRVSSNGQTISKRIIYLNE